MSYNSNIAATELLNALTSGSDFSIPDLDVSGSEFQFPGGTSSDLYKPVTRLTTADLTEGDIQGKGVFDELMRGMHVHLRKEYEANRITGAEYTKAYMAIIQSSISGAVQFILGRDAAYWQAQAAQIQAITARVALETAKVQAAQVKIAAQNERATYALTLTKLATEDATFSNAKFQRDELMPAQKQLINEQTEAQRAQTMDNRTDGTLVRGSVGKQKDLHNQQITSYKRDAEVKAAKIFADAWITQKTIDEGLLPPDGFTNTSLDQVLAAIKTNNELN